MIRKDYIQRYFDQLAKVLAAVLQLKNDLKPTEAEAQLNDFSTDFLGVNLAEIELQKPEELIGFLTQQKGFTLTHFKLLESVLYEKHLLLPTEKPLKEITLVVLEYASKNDKDYSVERMKRIEDLKS